MPQRDAQRGATIIVPGAIVFSDLETQLCEAVWEGDAGRVRELCAIGADLECYNDMGNTPLHLAIEQCDLEIVKILLERGADPNRTDRSRSWTPLGHAVDSVSDAASQLGRAPDNRIIQVLLQNGADVTVRDFHGWTPLFVARKYLNVEAQELLHEAGAKE